MQYRSPTVFGDDASAARHAQQIEDALARQTVRYAVAPGCTLTVPRGHLREGDEVRLNDLVHPSAPSADLQMQELVRKGVVLEATPEQVRAAKTPASARCVVAYRRSITSQRGILITGEQVEPDDVGGSERLQRLIERGVVVDREAPGDEPPDAA